MTTKPLSHLGEVTAEAMHQAGVSENAASLTSGISRQTLRRHLATDMGTAAKLGAVAHILGIDPDTLVARAVERGTK